MIQKLRRKMYLLVLLSLFIIICCFVLSINWFNWNALVDQANSTLEILVLNQGTRPSPQSDTSGHTATTPSGGSAARSTDGSTPPPKPEGESSNAPEPSTRSEEERKPSTKPAATPSIKPSQPSHGQPVSSRESIAGLSNYYTISLDSEGNVASWTSDRSDLYNDEQIMELVSQILASGKESGRIGTQFFRLSKSESSSSTLVVVLDERLEVMSAQDVIRYTLILGLAAYLLLSAGSVLLIRRMFVPVEEASRKQRQFVWDASHELKTPIAVISANTEVLEREIGNNEWLGYIRSELDRTSQLVQSLLELARTDRETTKASMQPFDLSRAILTVTLPFESTVFEAGKTMEVDVPEGIEMVGSSEMIQQLVIILLSNALKYGEAGGTIRLSLQVRGRNRIIRVYNTGSYISKDDISRIFDRFYRADASHSREVEGHGLGLAIASNIVETHGGKISVESDMIDGTTFIVTL